VSRRENLTGVLQSKALNAEGSQISSTGRGKIA